MPTFRTNPMKKISDLYQIRPTREGKFSKINKRPGSLIRGVQLFSPMFENPFLHPWWGYWKRVSTAILTYVWKSWVPEEHGWGESKENQLAILTHVWNMGETAHRWGESKENQLAILTHVYIHGCWKVSNFTHVYRCTDMTLGLTSLDAEKCLTSPVFTDALTWLWDWLL